MASRVEDVPRDFGTHRRDREVHRQPHLLDGVYDRTSALTQTCSPRSAAALGQSSSAHSGCTVVPTPAATSRFRAVFEPWLKFREEEYLWFRVAENSFDNFVYVQSQKKT
jgi:hypothetical protein